MSPVLAGAVTTGSGLGPRGAGLQFTSGVELYRVNNGVIDAGKFIPLDPPR